MFSEICNSVLVYPLLWCPSLSISLFPYNTSHIHPEGQTKASLCLVCVFVVLPETGLRHKSVSFCIAVGMKQLQLTFNQNLNIIFFLETKNYRIILLSLLIVKGHILNTRVWKVCRPNACECSKAGLGQRNQNVLSSSLHLN